MSRGQSPDLVPVRMGNAGRGTRSGAERWGDCRGVNRPTSCPYENGNYRYAEYTTGISETQFFAL